MLTNPTWVTNVILQAATAGGDPVRTGDVGPQVAILRKNLETIGFERTLEPIDFYGASTAGIIRDFRRIYNVPGKSELVDKPVLETIDAILNGKIPQRELTAAANIGAKGKDFAVKYLATTKEWVQNALWASRSVEQALMLAMNAGAEPDFESNVYQPFMQHFRLQICQRAVDDGFRSRVPKTLMLAYNDMDQATKSRRIREVIFKVNMIANVFNGIKVYLSQNVDTIFINAVDMTKAATPYTVAQHDPKTNKITFFAMTFFEVAPGVPNGKDRKSASGVTIHEAVHAVLGELSSHGQAAGVGDNPYSWRATYYGMNWQQASRNPSAYSHFAYQIATGKQNFGPWA
jgi:peptidoglycan hydrolase-like protein with peptidoglycan-binding domain